MKTPLDPRHIRRQKLLQGLFSWSFQGEIENQDELKPAFEKITKTATEIDTHIESAAPERPISQIAKVDLAILRLAVFELLEKDAPVKVVVDEAVELAKEFGGETSSSFVNGVLGTVIKKLEAENPTQEKTTE